MEKNAEKAVQLYTIAADADSAPGQYNLAKCMRDGVGVKVDEARAFSLFKRSAEQGFPIAYIELADCYTRGIGTKPDAELAEKYKKLAEESGYASEASATEKPENK